MGYQTDIQLVCSFKIFYWKSSANQNEDEKNYGKMKQLIKIKIKWFIYILFFCLFFFFIAFAFFLFCFFYTFTAKHLECCKEKRVLSSTFSSGCVLCKILCFSFTKQYRLHTSAVHHSPHLPPTVSPFKRKSDS